MVWSFRRWAERPEEVVQAGSRELRGQLATEARPWTHSLHINCPSRQQPQAVVTLSEQSVSCLAACSLFSLAASGLTTIRTLPNNARVPQSVCYVAQHCYAAGTLTQCNPNAFQWPLTRTSTWYTRLRAKSLEQLHSISQKYCSLLLTLSLLSRWLQLQRALARLVHSCLLIAQDYTDWIAYTDWTERVAAATDLSSAWLQE